MLADRVPWPIGFCPLSIRCNLVLGLPIRLVIIPFEGLVIILRSPSDSRMQTNNLATTVDSVRVLPVSFLWSALMAYCIVVHKAFGVLLSIYFRANRTKKGSSPFACDCREGNIVRFLRFCELSRKFSMAKVVQITIMFIFDIILIFRKSLNT